ncbi:MAG TPA: tRNA uridine-5-carboxymethylaminomethyl(34) synthesis GTPase MnmE [Rhodospirillales bacterium]|nr:tRNA uridine-5-carboxymethylaminomethyl(34) synthesis GTPase MnmE [Rhodospirillales bacterium]
MSLKTIYALASGFGLSGIAVIRISGSNAGAALRALTKNKLPTPRRAVMSDFINPADGSLLDKGLAIWFPEPHSFTGENIAELHVHGGRSVVSSLLKALSSCEGLRLAEPGEFSRRAFENNKFDLTAVEALADLINAETEHQQRQALRQMQGELGLLYESWRRILLEIIVQLEATIDFSDEDLPHDLERKADESIKNLFHEISSHLKDGRRGEILRCGVHAAIIGPPNSGKSSFLNLLTRRNTAIVSDVPGTTRDVIETRLDIGGYPVVIVDTAGLRDGGDEIEKEGIQRAKDKAQNADLKIAIFDVMQGPDPYTYDFIDKNTMVIANKIDIGPHKTPDEIKGHLPWRISLLTGDGIEEMLEGLENEIERRCHLSAAPLLTQARHRASLEDCRNALERFNQEAAIELQAEELRLAVRALGRITGRVDVEDILDEIFHDFCIGK